MDNQQTEENLKYTPQEVTCCERGKTLITTDPDDGHRLGRGWKISFCPFCGEPLPTKPYIHREVEVGIHFDLTKLDGPQRKLLWQAAHALKVIGIGFDSGSGGGELDWEWDWSLSGPVRVTFRRYVENNPENRHVCEKERPERDVAASVAASKRLEELVDAMEEESTEEEVMFDEESNR